MTGLPETVPPARRAPWLRLGAAAALVLAIVAGGRMAGLDLSPAELRASVAAAGPWGPLVYLGGYCVARLVWVPGAGLLSVGVAVALFGLPAGGALAYLASMLAVCVSFAVVRAAGGRALQQVSSGRLRDLLAQVEARPLQTVFLARLFLGSAAPVSYALALSPIGVRDYLLGSALGMLLPAAGVAAAFHLLFE
jgi:uncharacterized membrane protein YdjX (TVP38/TMEM64 family)